MSITIKHTGDVRIQPGSILIDGIPVVSGTQGPQGINGPLLSPGPIGTQGPDGSITGPRGPLGSASGSFSGTNYAFVSGGGTPTDNAIELQAAYDAAKSVASIFNPFTIVVNPGYYDFGSGTFDLNWSGISVVSLDGNRSVFIVSTSSVGAVDITATLILVKGIDVGTNYFRLSGSNLSNDEFRMENCKGGNFSFNGSGLYPLRGTFVNCEAGNYSFGRGGLYSTCYATFINCTAGNYSFGNEAPGCNSIMINCKGGVNCVTPTGTLAGTYIDCSFGSNSFNASGVGINNSGTYSNCSAGNFSYGHGFDGGATTGTFTDCVGGNGSFGSITSGTFTGCIGGVDSFGGDTGTLSGKLYYCRLTSGTFQTVSGGGRTYYCVDGNGNTNNQ
jgi:hypothetical protein